MPCLETFTLWDLNNGSNSTADTVPATLYQFPGVTYQVMDA